MAHSFTRTLVALAVGSAMISPLLAADKGVNEVMVVSGSRMAQKLEDVSSPITVVTDKQIEEQGVSNAAELFRYEPGVATVGGSGETSTFVIRGMSKNRVKVVQDGVRQNNAYSSGGVGQTYFDTDMIKQVEVAKGPSSAAYGSDALGGVIAITTKEASDVLKGKARHLEVSSGYQSASHQHSAGITGALRSGDVESLLRYTWRDGGVTQNHAGDQNEFDVLNHALLLKSKWHVSAEQFLQLSVNYLHEGMDPHHVDLPTSSRVSTFDQPITDKKTDNLSVMLDHGIALNASWVDRVDSKLYYSRMKQDLDQYAFASRYYLTSFDSNRFEQESLGAQLKLTKEAGAHRLAWGMDYEHSNNERRRLKTAAFSGTFPDYDETSFPDTTTQRGALWAFDEVRFGQRWVLTPGLRYDYYRMKPDDDPAYTGSALKTFSDGELSPKLGLVYKAHPLANLFAQYSHGFKAPMYDEAFATLNHSGYFYRIEPNPDLNAERSDGIDAGVRGGNGRLNYELSAFYTQYKDFITSTYIGQEGRTTLYQYQNLDDVRTKGLEAKSDYWVSDMINVWGNLAYIEGKDGDGHYINELSPFKGSVGARLEQPNWNLNTALRFASRMDKVSQDSQGNDNIGAAGWAAWDIYAQFTPLPQLQLNVGVFNLLDKEYVNYESVAGKGAGSDVAQFTEPGRSLSARIKYQF